MPEDIDFNPAQGNFITWSRILLGVTYWPQTSLVQVVHVEPKSYNYINRASINYLMPISMTALHLPLLILILMNLVRHRIYI